jgi:hypothetical protein
MNVQRLARAWRNWNGSTDDGAVELDELSAAVRELIAHPQPKPTPVLTVEDAVRAVIRVTFPDGSLAAGKWSGFEIEQLRERLTAKATTTP